MPNQSSGDRGEISPELPSQVSFSQITGQLEWCPVLGSSSRPENKPRDGAYGLGLRSTFAFSHAPDVVHFSELNDGI